MKRKQQPKRRLKFQEKTLNITPTMDLRLQNWIFLIKKLKKLIEQQLSILSTNFKGQKEIEESTRKQSDNPNWFEARKFRLTASIFGNVCKRKLNHGKLVQDILYKTPPNVKAIEYGKLNEFIDIDAYSTKK